MYEIKLNTLNFTDEVLFAGMPVLVEFWAPWCSACRQLAPIVERIAEENPGRLKVGRVNVDEEPMLAARYGVRGVPKLVLFEGGKVIGSAVGLQSRKRIEEELLSLVRKERRPA